jgi:hypothetical protein
MEDILGLGKPVKLDAVRRVKGWVAARPAVPDDATVMVSELRCHEDGCPDVETVIAVMPAGGERKQVKLPKPMDQVTEDDISAAF